MWEHAIVRVALGKSDSLESFVKVLDAMGAGGWELVHVDHWDKKVRDFWFRRSKS